MKQTMSRKILASSFALILMLSMLLSSCAPEGIGQSQPVRTSSTDVAAELQAKYENDRTVNYAEGENLIARDHEFIISYEFDPLEIGMDSYDQIASLYYDAELTQPVLSTYDWIDDDKKSYSISPWEYPGRAAMATDAEDYPYGFTQGSSRLFEKEPYADWGNSGTMYLATKVDLTTGKTLAKPTVQVVTVKGELDTPQLSLDLGDDGLVTFSWNEVKGAKAYYIVEFSTDDDGSILSASLIGQTTDTEWSSETVVDSVTDATFASNSDFKTYLISEDDWFNDAMVDAYENEFNPKDGAVASVGAEDKLFSVIAVNDKGSSMYSRTLDIKDIASLAPATLAYNMEDLSDEGFSGYVKGVPMMPSYRWVVMCDGVLSQRLVEYDFDAAKTDTETWYFGADGSDNYTAISMDVIKVPYTVSGTPFTGTLIISEYDEVAWKSQLESVENRQNSLRSKTGDVQREIRTEDEEESTPSREPVESELITGDSLVTANSALSEYLALNMLSGVEEVDLRSFPEALDEEYLVDAWMEAFYQNPLALGVMEVAVSRDGKTLYIEYEDDQATRERKQTEITEEVDKVVAEIIDNSMTAAEKEFAINEYLCETVIYDEDALNNAAENNYMSVDSEYYDSFTAYGALINGVGVCASYSASFKLLADAAGLDSVVVTGYLDGTLAHAWNRVDLGNGQWATVDSTNNDMDVLPNALMNVPDSALATTLVEDDLWLMNSSLSAYQNEDDSDEFYHVEGLFYDDYDDVVDTIVDQLTTFGVSAVRTDYALTDAEFYEIGEDVAYAAELGEIGGYYWLGVIVFMSDPSMLM